MTRLTAFFLSLLFLAPAYATERTDTYLKSRYEANDAPTATDFSDFIESKAGWADMGAVAVRADDLTAGTGATAAQITANTTAIQAAIDAADTASKKTVVPAGTYKFNDVTLKGRVEFSGGTYYGNFTLTSKTSVSGHGVAKTTFKPTADAAVFGVSATASTTYIVLQDFLINGTDTKESFTSQDGISLKPVAASTWVDPVTIRRVRVQNCGRYGIHASGTSTTGPFVQRLHLEQVDVTECTSYGLLLEGCVLETTIVNTFVTKNGGSAGTTPNAAFMLGSGERQKRITWVGGGVNHFTALNAGNAGTGLLLQGPDQVSLIGVDFESSDPMIQMTHAFTRNISIITCNFGSAFNRTHSSYIDVNNVKGLLVENSNFAVVTGSVDRFIDVNIEASLARDIRISPTNQFNGTVNVKAVDFNREVTIASGVIYAYQDNLLVDTEADAASDDLDSIYDSSGSGTSTRFTDGFRLTLRPKNPLRTVNVKSLTGNIALANNRGFTMSNGNDTLELVWDANLARWQELARSPHDLENTETIAAGVIAATSDFMWVDTEGSAASDDLTTIYDMTGGTSTAQNENGRVIILAGKDAARVVTVKNGAGIRLDGGVDMVMSSIDDRLVLCWDKSRTRWNEVGRVYGATAPTYAATNVSTDRAYDANATTTDELADVLGTLIADLRAIGLVK